MNPREQTQECRTHWLLLHPHISSHLPSLWGLHLPACSEMVPGAPILYLGRTASRGGGESISSCILFNRARKTSPDPTLPAFCHVSLLRSTHTRQIWLLRMASPNSWVQWMSGQLQMTTTIIFLHLFISHSCLDYFSFSISFFHGLYSSA